MKYARRLIIVASDSSFRASSSSSSSLHSFRSPVNCINVAMAIDPTYHRRLVNGDFNASSPVADICLQGEAEFPPGYRFDVNGLDGPHRWNRGVEDVEVTETVSGGETDLLFDVSTPSTSVPSSAALPAYARDPRLSQDLSTLFPAVSPRNAGSSSSSSAGTSNGNADGAGPKRRNQRTSPSMATVLGDPFVEEEIQWRDGEENCGIISEEGYPEEGYEEEEVEEEEQPQPIMLVRGTKRATLRQSQATAVATAVAKENGGKKKREKNSCKTQ